MAPRHHQQKSARPRQPAESSSNARGYAKRKERKPSTSLDPADAYEYAAEKNRRAGVELDLGRDDQARGHGGSDEDSDGDGVDLDDNLRAKIARRIQEDHVRSEDDEDIDSDDAFDDEDEQRFGSYKFAQSKKVSVTHFPLDMCS